ncbi:hypothetical protein HHK36_026356 [Tetracentron sinense]|uniref:Uncharacterized protein n=1 Tax=Tetracentron sinense TaxID=13715 RepID=A0A834YF96_TETSI|nr:hypothetical protein HHK36_026356 [Tetracentron sinense]
MPLQVSEKGNFVNIFYELRALDIFVEARIVPIPNLKRKQAYEGDPELTVAALRRAASVTTLTNYSLALRSP